MQKKGQFATGIHAAVISQDASALKQLHHRGADIEAKNQVQPAIWSLFAFAPATTALMPPGRRSMPSAIAFTLICSTYLSSVPRLFIVVLVMTKIFPHHVHTSQTLVALAVRMCFLCTAQAALVFALLLPDLT